MKNLTTDKTARSDHLLPGATAPRANTIVLLIPCFVPAVFSDPAFSPLVQGIAQECHHHQYQMLLYLCHESTDERSIRAQLQCTQGLAGIIYIATADDPLIAGLMRLEKPLLLLEPLQFTDPGSSATYWSPPAESPMIAAGRQAANRILQLVTSMPAAGRSARPLVKEAAWGAVN